MEPQTKKLLLIAAVMLIAFGLFATIIETSKALIKDTDPLLQNPGDIVSTAAETRFNHNGEILNFPAPEGYCFLDLNQDIDKMIFAVVNNMQKTYSNHLWAVFVDCSHLEAVRTSKDLSTYMDTGLIITPSIYLTQATSAEDFVAIISKQIEQLDPVKLQDMISDNLNNITLPESPSVKTGQPFIYKHEEDEFLFTISHDLSDKSGKKFRLTEFDVATALKDRALMVLFTYRDLGDTKPRQDYTLSYLGKLRAAN